MSTNTVVIPEELLAKLQAAAQAEGKTVNQAVTEAVARYVEAQENVRELHELASWGERHASERGFKPSDVERAILDIRRGR